MSAMRDWLERSGFGKYAEAFEREEIELADLAVLSEADLAALGLPLGPRKRLLRAIAERSETARDGTVTTSREAERRHLTVMFCDLVGSTSLSERLDPEDLRTLMQAYQKVCGEVVARYEGHVAQYLGDGIMVYFGWPRAHDDDSERAVRAGLEIVAGVKTIDAPEPLRVRIGIATGPVVVGETGDGDASLSKLAVGETPNLAARVQGLAREDGIVLAPITHRLAGSAFLYEDLGKCVLKGVVQPVRCWRILGVRRPRGRHDVPDIEGMTPFVGRERERAELESRLAAAERGHGQVVVLIGDPGVGKSRLLLEFRRRAGDRVAWSEGRSISFGRAMAFHPLVDMLRKNFGLEEDDTPEAIRDKVSAEIVRVAPDLAAAAPYLHYLLGVATADDPVHRIDPQMRRAETFDALRRLLAAAAQRRTQVVLFEDLHWSDSATVDFLNAVLDSIPASRSLLLVTLRTGYPPPFDERSYVTRLVLDNLAPEDSTRIVQAVLAAPDLPEALLPLVHRKAEGNPFFVEELVKSLRESGAIRREGNEWVLGRPLEQIVIPDTVQGVLMARIDHVAEEARHTLQLAAVIGREFTQRLLDRISDIRERTSDSLKELQAIELIYQKALYPELAFMFKHALAQDVAYGSLLLQRRRDLHRRIARAIEEIYADRLDEHYAMIAHHFAGAEDWAKAAVYCEKAADQAASTFAVVEALDLSRAALAALERSGAPDARVRAATIHGKMAGLYMLASDFERAHAAHAEAARYAWELGETPRAGWAIAGMAMTSFYGYDLERATAEARQAIDIGHAAGIDDLVAAGMLTEASVAAVTGHPAEACSKLEESVLLASGSTEFFSAVPASWISLTLTWQGAYEQAVARGSANIALARERNQAFPLIFALFSTGLALSGRGDFDQALVTFQEGLVLAEKVGDEILRNRLLNSLGWIHAECGDAEQAIRLNERARDFSTMRGDPETIANAELNLGDAALAAGDRALAREWFDAVHKLAGNPATSDWMKWRYSQHLFAGYGETCLALGDPAAADDWANACLDLATRTDSTKYLVRGWRLKADIAVARLGWEEAEEALKRSLAVAERIGNPTQLWRTRLALARLYGETGRPDWARKHARGAQKVLDGMRATVKTPSLRESFVGSSFIRSIYERIEAV